MNRARRLAINVNSQYLIYYSHLKVYFNTGLDLSGVKSGNSFENSVKRSSKNEPGGLIFTIIQILKYLTILSSPYHLLAGEFNYPAVTAPGVCISSKNLNGYFLLDIYIIF